MRLRRLRSSEAIRESLAETRVDIGQLIAPLFIVQKENFCKEIPSMPGVYQYSPEKALEEVLDLLSHGVKSFILFGIPEKKDFEGLEASNPEGPVPKTLRILKEEMGKEVVLYADVCLCEYTTHGHCGIPNEQGEVQNDPSLVNLAQAALEYAKAGADWVAPSNMMDHRVAPLREKLDDNGFTNTSILSYSAKFSSNYYGPFRDAAESPPSFGDRKSYQIDYRNIRQPLREIINDEKQGADAVMVKPALAYLDIISKAREITTLPLYAYNVSGEYSMVKFGAQHGLFDEKALVIENLTSIIRAGADMILTYHAAEAARKKWLI